MLHSFTGSKADVSSLGFRSLTAHRRLSSPALPRISISRTQNVRSAAVATPPSPSQIEKLEKLTAKNGSVRYTSPSPAYAPVRPLMPSRKAEVSALRATVTVRRKRHPSPQEILTDGIDSLSDLAGQKIVLQLVSCETDNRTGAPLRSSAAPLQDWSQKAHIVADKVQYNAHFTLPKGFGEPGAITIVNNHQNEVFIETIAIQGLPTGTVYFSCYSWVQPKHKNSEERVFFTNEACLPMETPEGLKELREKDKASLRGNGKGTRQPWENVYDYDVYNDVGNIDENEEFARPILGGNANFPYPRRCRTGRMSTKKDSKAEKPLKLGENYYVPRDEAFEETKRETFISNSLKGVIHQLSSSISNSLKENTESFECLHDIDKLYQEGLKLKTFEDNDFLKMFPLGKTIKGVEDSMNQVQDMLQYDQPDILSRDRYAWQRDDEFGRQALAGANPVHIQRLEEFPPKSMLDEKVYGSPISAIKKEHIESRLEGLTVEEAIKEGKLFMLDYHDAYMPFVNKVNALEGRKMYATRTILFHTRTGTLMPVAIELSLPPAGKGGDARRRVFTPAQDASGYWMWELAKAHVRSNDAGFHQLVNHWLRSHASVEPYVIASHRQLSRMHPVFKLLEPHFRYTLEINASARQLLINADGVIENCFTPGPYALEISSAAYKGLWRFDQESLPADLLKRGMAVPDETQPNGIKLVIEDYPYAADAMLMWDAIKEWVDEYISLYYHDDESILEDTEILAWWDEIKNKGHADKKDEPWWPELRTPEDLKSILTTIIWIVSGFHAAVNFGQYAYGGYVPNRPSLTRRLIPEEGTPEYRELCQNPEEFFLSCIPNQVQATTVMAIVDTLSSHSPDEEYLGERAQTKWTNDRRALDAFKRFSMQMGSIERMIKQRNEDPSLKNRSGAGVLPYETLMPTSRAGKTGRGVPNSISI